MADNGNSEEESEKQQRLRSKHDVKRLCPFVKTILRVIWRNVLKLFNNNKKSMEQKREVFTREDSRETELLCSVEDFIAPLLTLQWLKGNQTVRTSCHSSETQKICHKIGT